MSAAATPSARTPLPPVLWALMVGNFVIGTGVMVVPGTLTDISQSLGVSIPKAGQLITELTPRQIDELVADGTISGGMLPKLAGAIDAAKSGVNAVHVVDGRVPHAMLLEILTDQAYGTMIRSH